ncbi:MAG: siderophore ferric iron reductase [Oleiphilaceae bacterium]|nr:siderophore ferric iron reductase [Oleiphilaceae bacterium]
MALAVTTEQARFRSLALRMHPALEALDPPLPDPRGPVHPSAGGRGKAPWLIRAGCDNRDAISALYQHWQQAFPQAGMPYWSVRCWTLLHWQPVFLAVAAVHGAGLVPPLTALSQKLGSEGDYKGIVAGYYLPPRGWSRPSIGQAGAMLERLCQELLQQLNQVTAIKPLSARRLVADTLLLALCRLPLISTALTTRQILALSRQWLDATGLTQQSALVPVRLECGREALVLDRKGCCMDYRRQGGEICASCPRRKRPQRLQLQMEELSRATDTV